MRKGVSGLEGLEQGSRQNAIVERGGDVTVLLLRLGLRAARGGKGARAVQGGQGWRGPDEETCFSALYSLGPLNLCMGGGCGGDVKEREVVEAA